MSEPNDLKAFLDDAWQHLRDGVAQADAPARLPTMATVSPEGLPEARTVALRRAAQDAAELEVHTDTRTAKIKSLRAAPHVALHVWVPSAQVQIRLNGMVDIRTGPEVAAEWDRVPLASRVSYGTEPAPGTAIAHVYDYEKPPNQARFAVLRIRLATIDLVHLGDNHRRARYVGKDNWQGTWVAP